MSAIDFYFDFSSPYGYFASEQIDSIASKYGRTVAWYPYLMGAAMKMNQRKPLVHMPMFEEYSRRDLDRCARMLEIPYRTPTQFPVATVAACRAYYWLADCDSDLTRQLAHLLFRAYFVDDRNISDSAVVVKVAEAVGINRNELEAALEDQAVKDRVRQVTDSAIEKKVFGSPFFVVDNEPFWGHDRIYQVEKWLETGGW